MVFRADAEIRVNRNVLQDLRTHDRVLLYECVFFVSQFPLLIDDVFGNTDLAYVVKERNIVDLITFRRALSCVFGDLFGILGNSRRVTVGVFVFRIDRVYESCRSLGKEPFDVLVFLFLFRELELERDHYADDRTDYQECHCAVKVIAELRILGNIFRMVITDYPDAGHDDSFADKHRDLELAFKYKCDIECSKQKPDRRAAFNTAVGKEHRRHEDKYQYDRQDDLCLHDALCLIGINNIESEKYRADKC